jgi:hypothetical protein
MGRHTADTQSVRAPRQGDSSLVIGERRAALGRSHDIATAARQATPEPVSVAASRQSDEHAFAHAVPTSPPVAPDATRAAASARITKVRRTPKAVAKTGTVTAARTANAFLRRRATIPALSFFAVFGFAATSMVNPLTASAASAAVIAPTLPSAPAAQQYTAHGTYADTNVSRDGYSITKPAPVVTTTTTSTTSTSTTSTSTTKKTASASAPAAGTPDPGSAQAIALQMVTARGWGQDQYSCLVSLWNRESGWNVYAYNPSGAYGIPQALPGSKMATVGADWQTNPATQITWGLNYITGSYGTPCGAWAHSQSYNWY